MQNSRIAICSYHSKPVWPGGPPVPELDDMQGIMPRKHQQRLLGIAGILFKDQGSCSWTAKYWMAWLRCCRGENNSAQWA